MNNDYSNKYYDKIYPMNIKAIKTEEEYNLAIKRLEKILTLSAVNSVKL